MDNFLFDATKYERFHQQTLDPDAFQLVSLIENTLPLLLCFAIDDFQSEPHQKNQNFFERWWQVIKRLTITILDWSGAQPNEWFLVLEYVVYIRNLMAVKSLGWMTPLEKLTGKTPDIVSKHWSHNKIWHVLQPILFWKGDTLQCRTPR